jgi:hypothetical protein
MRVSINITASTVRIASLFVVAAIAAYCGLYFGNGPDREGAAYIGMAFELIVPPVVIFGTVCAVLSLVFRRWGWAYAFFAPTLFFAIFLLALEYHFSH